MFCLASTNVMGNFGYTKSFVFNGVLDIVWFSPGSRDASFLGINDVVLGPNPFCRKAPSRSKFLEPNPLDFFDSNQANVSI